MRNLFRYFQIIAFIILLIKADGSFSQTCQCSEYYVLKANQAKTGVSSKKAIVQLQISSNAICKAKSYEWLANDFLAENDFKNAEINLQNAEKIYQQSSCGDSILLTTYKTWAALYYTKSDFAKAQVYSLKMLNAAEIAHDVYEQALGYTMISQLFNQTGQANKGIVFARKAIPFLSQIKNPSLKATVLFTLSKRYLWHYQDTKTKSSLDSSEMFGLQQLAIAKNIDRKSAIANGFNHLQGIAYERDNLPRAIQYLDSSFKYVAKDDLSTLAVNYFDKADILLELKKYNEAETMADSALYFYKKTESISFIADVHVLLAKIAQKKGDYQKAFENNELGRAITDSIRNLEKTKEVAELEKKYTQAKNEKTIKELAQQKQIYLLLALTGLLGLVALGFFIRQQALKNKQQIMETEQRLNRARMNPHFFFNALSSLQTFALQGNDGKSIATNLSKFSHIMRETLESTYKDYVTLEQEIDFLEEYMSLQKMRFPQKFSYTIQLNETIEAHETLIPSMILQPFIENCIEHGFAGIDYEGKIMISFNTEAKELMVVITDNGIGLATTIKENNEHISRASQIIRDRIFLLNIKLKTKAAFSVDNIVNEKGVIVSIKLPLLEKKDIA